MRRAAPMTAGSADAGALRMIGFAFSAITAGVALMALISLLANSGAS